MGNSTPTVRTLELEVFKQTLITCVTSSTEINGSLLAGPLFFHGFLKPISRAREIENDEFHGLILQFHGHFTG